MNYKIKLIIIFIIALIGCSRQFNNPVIKNLEFKNKSMTLNGDSLMINHKNEYLSFIDAFTRKEFRKYDIAFSFKKENPDNSVSFFIHYKDSANHYRLNIFPGTGKIHLYKKEKNKVKTLLHSKINGFNADKNNNVFRIIVNNYSLKIFIDNSLIFFEKIDNNSGKFGIGSYGKKGEKTEVSFRK